MHKEYPRWPADRAGAMTAAADIVGEEGFAANRHLIRYAVLKQKGTVRYPLQITRFSISIVSSPDDRPNSSHKISVLCSPISGARREMRHGEPL